VSDNTGPENEGPIKIDHKTERQYWKISDQNWKAENAWPERRKMWYNKRSDQKCRASNGGPKRQRWKIQHPPENAAPNFLYKWSWKTQIYSDFL